MFDYQSALSRAKDCSALSSSTRCWENSTIHNLSVFTPPQNKSHNASRFLGLFQRSDSSGPNQPVGGKPIVGQATAACGCSPPCSYRPGCPGRPSNKKLEGMNQKWWVKEVLPSGRVKDCYWKLPVNAIYIKVIYPTNMVIFHSYVSLPEGNGPKISVLGSSHGAAQLSFPKCLKYFERSDD